MVPLSVLLQGLVDASTRASVMSASATLEVAEVYRTHPTLKHFPVPHFQIGDIDFEVPIAIAEQLFVCDAEFKNRFRTLLESNLSVLPAFDDIAGLEAWSQRLPVLLDAAISDVSEGPLSTADLSQSVVMRLSTESAVDNAAFGNWLQVCVEKSVASAMMQPSANLEDAISSSVLVLSGAQELKDRDPALLAKIKMTLNVADRRWVALEVDGEKSMRLEG